MLKYTLISPSTLSNRSVLSSKLQGASHFNLKHFILMSEPSTKPPRSITKKKMRKKQQSYRTKGHRNCVYNPLFHRECTTNQTTTTRLFIYRRSFRFSSSHPPHSGAGGHTKLRRMCTVCILFLVESHLHRASNVSLNARAHVMHAVGPASGRRAPADWPSTINRE